MNSEIQKSSRHTRNAAILPVILFFWTLASLIIPNAVLDITDRYDWATAALNLLLPVSAYALLLTYRRRIGVAVVLTLPLMIFGAFQLVLSYLYGEAIIAVDMFLNVATTNVDEVNELLGNLIYAIGAVVVLYLPPLIAGIIGIIKKWRLGERLSQRARKLAIAGIGCSAILTGIVAIRSSFGSLRHTLFPVNVVCNLAEAINRTVKTNHYEQTCAGFSHRARSTRGAGEREVYVMVIGETSRAINWQLAGYGRPTNPRLSEDPNLAFFSRSISESNTTHKSVPMLMSHLSAENFDSIYSSKSIISAMKEAGFHTYFFSNQTANRSFTQFFGDEADEVRYTELGGKTHPYDDELAIWLREAVADTTHAKQFFVLHTYGSHFLYKDRYPAEYTYFTPDNALDANRANRESLINGYDNSIRYTDGMLADVIGALRTVDGRAAMVYSADHGEDIFDDERNRFLHASPHPTYYQLHVASLAWMNDSLACNRPDYAASLTQNAGKPVSPQKSLFPTMLEMAGVSTPLLHRQHSLVDSAYRYEGPVYLTDVNQCVPLHEAGIKESDRKKIDTLIRRHD